MRKLAGLVLLILCFLGIYLLFFNIDKNAKSAEEQNKEMENQLKTEGLSIPKEDIVVLSEKMFLINLDEIYANYKNYEGKYLQLDGFIFNIHETGNPLVAREYSCCGPDNFLIGVECEDTKVEYSDNTWVRAIGKIKIVEDKENKLNPIIINLTEVTMEEIPEGTRLVSY